MKDKSESAKERVAAFYIKRAQQSLQTHQRTYVRRSCPLRVSNFLRQLFHHPKIKFARPQYRNGVHLKEVPR